MSRSVVITGMGAVSPLGVGARTLYERWLGGQSGIEDGKGAATEFEPTEHLSVKEVRRADRFTQFALVAGDEALAEAGWSDELPYEGERIASILGTGIGGIGTLEGPIVGAIVLYFLQDYLAGFGAWYLISLGALAVAVMLVAPKGIWGYVAGRFDIEIFPTRRRLR